MLSVGAVDSIWTVGCMGAHYLHFGAHFIRKFSRVEARLQRMGFQRPSRGYESLSQISTPIATAGIHSSAARAAGSGPKPVIWIGSSRKDLKTLPEPVQKGMGYALWFAQIG